MPSPILQNLMCFPKWQVIIHHLYPAFYPTGTNEESSPKRLRQLFGEVQIVSEPFPRLHLRHIETGRAVGEGRKEEETPESCGEDDAGGDPAAHLAGSGHALADRSRLRAAVALDGRRLNIHRLDAEDELNQRACDKTRGEMGGKIMVQEELTAHDVERDVVSCPCQEEEAGRVV